MTTSTSTSSTDTFKYQVGFGNELESEAVEGALIKGRNNPKNVPLGVSIVCFAVFFGTYYIYISWHCLI
jgi:homogentisate 1,2-dioxygenase